MGGNTRANSAGVARVGKRAGFTLVELLVVIGIISILISILLPSLSKMRVHANAVSCATNLHQLGVILQMYCNDNNGWLYPVGPEMDAKPTTLGANRPPHERWPMRVAAFDVYPPETLPYDPQAYLAAYASDAHAAASDEAHFPTAPYTPKILKCPADEEGLAAHTYILNKHLADKKIKVNTRDFGGRTSSDVIVAGEKKSTGVDYYLEANEFEKLAERYMHGISRGSNYLYHDGHVGTVLPSEAAPGLDPWDVKLVAPTSKPGT